MKEAKTHRWIMQKARKDEKSDEFETGSISKGLTRVKTFRYSCSLFEQLVTEWASHACCNRLSLHSHNLIRHRSRSRFTFFLTLTQSTQHVYCMLYLHISPTPSNFTFIFDGIVTCINRRKLSEEKKETRKVE